MSRREFLIMLSWGAVGFALSLVDLFGIGTNRTRVSSAFPSGIEKGMTSLNEKPINAEVTPILVNLLARYVNNVNDKNQSDIAFEAAIRKIPNSKEIAKRIIQNFEKIPLENRQDVYGLGGDIIMHKVSAERYIEAFERATTTLRIYSPSVREQVRNDNKIGVKHDDQASTNFIENGITFGDARTGMIWTDGQQSMFTSQ